MGWLIICLVLFLIAVGINILSCIKYWDIIVIDAVCVLLETGALGATIILSVCMIDTLSSEKITISKYENIEKAITVTIVPSDTLMKEIFDMNEEILTCKVKANNFMTKGLYSKKVANLELLPIPESFLNVEIEYD